MGMATTMGMPIQTLIMRITWEKSPQRGTFGAASPWPSQGLESHDDGADGQEVAGIHACGSGWYHSCSFYKGKSTELSSRMNREPWCRGTRAHDEISGIDTM